MLDEKQRPSCLDTDLAQHRESWERLKKSPQEIKTDNLLLLVDRVTSPPNLHRYKMTSIFGFAINSPRPQFEIEYHYDEWATMGHQQRGNIFIDNVGQPTAYFGYFYDSREHHNPVGSPKDPIADQLWLHGWVGLGFVSNKHVVYKTGLDYDAHTGEYAHRLHNLINELFSLNRQGQPQRLEGIRIIQNSNLQMQFLSESQVIEQASLPKRISHQDIEKLVQLATLPDDILAKTANELPAWPDKLGMRFDILRQPLAVNMRHRWNFWWEEKAAPTPIGSQS